MKFSQAVICKVFASLIAFVCTIILTFVVLYPTHLPLSQALRVSLNSLAPGCTQSADESKATVQTVFEGKLGLENLSSADHSDPTSAMGKPQWGLLWVQRNETYKQGWGISMFHALHHLEMIRDELDNRTRHQTRDAVLGRSAGNRENDHQREDHVHHCLAYIAQVITCAGDGTIEPPWEVTDASGNIMKYGVDGEGYQHQCRDTRQLWEVSLRSGEHAVIPWDWHMGDTVESVNLQFQG